MQPTSPRFPAAVAALIAGTLLTVVAQSPRIVTIRTTPEQRKAYLGRAVIWQNPGTLSPDDLINGPPGAFPYTFEQATAGTGISCKFLAPGRTLGGKSAKFLCLTDDAQTLRLKYWDQQGESGNREVFAAVAATRLLWALGFKTVPAMPVDLMCRGCPADPMTGEGTASDRRYRALMSFELAQPVIVSSGNRDQGWAWQELYEAVMALPPGEQKLRQITHLGALTLLGVLVQHGDRKPEQQSLYCDWDAAPTSGEIKAVKNKPGEAVLTEAKGTATCANPVVAATDIGATFGGAGKMTKGSTSKMNLEKWTEKPVFKESDGPECHGELTVSMAAEGGRADPPIREEGRRFLVEQLRRLTPEHVRALFKVARVDKLGLDEGERKAGAAVDPVQAWADAFEDKVKQIESRRCAPFAPTM
jgi:hypothetical protein